MRSGPSGAACAGDYGSDEEEAADSVAAGSVERNGCRTGTFSEEKHATNSKKYEGTQKGSRDDVDKL